MTTPGRVDATKLDISLLGMQNLSLIDQAMKSFIPSSNLQEIDRILEPQIKFQKRMQDLFKPHQLQEQIDKYLAPQRQLEEQINKFLEPRRQIQKQIDKYIVPQRQFEEQIRKFLESQRQLQAQMDKYFAPQLRLEEHIEQYLHPRHQLQEQVAKYLGSISDYLSDPLVATVNVDQSGCITVGNESVSAEAIQKHVTEFTVQSEVGGQLFDAFFEWLKKLEPVARAAILYLVLPYVVSIIANLTTPIFEEWWKAIRDVEPRVAKKEIINLATKSYDAQYLREYRFVVAKTLIVRESNRQKSAILDELHLGKTVRLIERNKQWSFVEYSDELSSSHKQGWVLSRYIAKFEKI